MSDPVAHQEAAERIAREWAELQREFDAQGSNTPDPWSILATAYLDLLAQHREAQAEIKSQIDREVAACPGSYGWEETIANITAELGRARKALEDTSIAGIFDVFRDIPDAIEQMGLHIKELEAQLREAEKLREFVEWCMATASWQGYDLHGGDMQDKAEELGLLAKVPADEAFREEYDSDEMFVVAWSPLAALLHQQRRGSELRHHPKGNGPRRSTKGAADAR